MTMKRSIFALGVAAMLAFAAFAFMGDSAANACCAGDPTLTTENAMTISNVGSPITLPTGSLTYNISTTDVNNAVPADTDGAANVGYEGFAWEVAGNDTPMTFTAFSHPNTGPSGIGTCTAPATSFPFGPGVLEIYGGGAGCIDVSGPPPSTFIGILATVTATCNAPAVTAVALLGLDSDPLFGTTTLDATGAIIPTELYPQQPNPSFPAFGPPTIAAAPFICLNPVDMSIVKTANATAIVGGVGQYMITVSNPSSGPLPVNIGDTMPAGVTATAVDNGPACVVNGGGTSVSCTGLVVPATSSVTVTVDVSFTTCGNKANTATVSAGIVPPGVPAYADPNPANDSSVANTNVDCAVLTVTKTGPANAIIGAPLVYNVQICNDGPTGTTATNIVVSDNPGPVAPANYASLAPGACVNSTVNAVAGPGAGLQCNTASATQDAATGGPSNNSQACTLVATAFPDIDGFAKDGDTGDGISSDADADATINLWICKGAGFPGNFVGPAAPGKLPGSQDNCNQLVFGEILVVGPDVDTCNDDDDDDGDAATAPDGSCAGIPNPPAVGAAETGAQCNGFNAQVDNDLDGTVNDGCPNSGLPDTCPLAAGVENYIPGQTTVDCNGGEVAEGIGAWELQIKYDHKLFAQPTATCEQGPFGNRVVQPQVTVITENWTLFGCVSKSEAQGEDQIPFVPGATDFSGYASFVTLTIQPDLFQRIRPTKDNGVVTDLLDENCEVADAFGMPLPGSVQGGLQPDCRDLTVTIRMLEGDINLDCNVDLADDQEIAFRYGAFFGNLLYNKFFDLEPNLAPDFDIDIKDLQTVFGRNGSMCSMPIPDQNPQSMVPDP